MVIIEVRKKEVSFEEIYDIIRKHFQKYKFEISDYNFPLLQVGIEQGSRYSRLLFHGKYKYNENILEEGFTITSFNQKFTEISKKLESKLEYFDFKIIIEEDY